MPYKKLNYETQQFEICGDFSKMLYLCPDVRRTGSGPVGKKQAAQLAAQFRKVLKEIGDLADQVQQDGVILDFWLVITPRTMRTIDPARMGDYALDEDKRNNYLVAPFNVSDLDLIERLVVPAGAFGDEDGPCLGVYVALELNDQDDDFKAALAHVATQTEDDPYPMVMLNRCIELAADACEWAKDQTIRAFIPMASGAHVEQYFVPKCAQPTHAYGRDFPLGAGYLPGLWAEPSKPLRKYRVSEDPTVSSGYDFCRYALTKEDLVAKKAEFWESPWADEAYLGPFAPLTPAQASEYKAPPDDLSYDQVLANWVEEFHLCGDFPDEVKILFDCFGENEDGSEDKSSLCYAVLVHKLSGWPGFKYPERDTYHLGMAVQYEDMEWFYVWVDADGKYQHCSEGSSAFAAVARGLIEDLGNAYYPTLPVKYSPNALLPDGSLNPAVTWPFELPSEKKPTAKKVVAKKIVVTTGKKASKEKTPTSKVVKKTVTKKPATKP